MYPLYIVREMIYIIYSYLSRMRVHCIDMIQISNYQATCYNGYYSQCIIIDYVLIILYIQYKTFNFD
jgi:hypothetical protein